MAVTFRMLTSFHVDRDKEGKGRKKDILTSKMKWFDKITTQQPLFEKKHFERENKKKK